MSDRLVIDPTGVRGLGAGALTWGQGAAILDMALALGNKGLSQLGIEVHVEVRDHYTCTDGHVFDEHGWEGELTWDPEDGEWLTLHYHRTEVVERTVADQLAVLRGEEEPEEEPDGSTILDPPTFPLGPEWTDPLPEPVTASAG